MSSWGFSRESTQVAAGANTQAGIKAGYQPFADADNMVSKRNVIATSLGWVRRQHKTDAHGNARKIDEVLVAASPGSGLAYTANTYLGKPDIAQIYVKLNANGVLAANAASANLYVVFNTPIHFKASGNLCTISVANTVGGNHALAVFANTAVQGRIVNANNTLVFRLPPLRGGVGSADATYQVNAQSITVSGNPLYNPDQSITHSANLVITGAVANNVLDGLGRRITTFTVRPGG